MTALDGPDRTFSLDPFQIEAMSHLDKNKSVIVAAPTGAGKTVIAEHAIDLTLAAGSKTFYTTPIKALSNQKYQDFAARYGAENVGLLTGDTSLNGEAPVVVMTTEVLRNMLYSTSRTLTGLATVVLDEVHYLQDQYRGPVWEEVIIHTSRSVRFVCLSATVSNASELAEWMTAVRDQTELVVHETRPVELTNLYMVGDRDSPRPHLVPTLVDGEPNPEGARFENPKRGSRSRSRPRRRFSAPRRLDVLSSLKEKSLLPAIVFVFSRAGCDDAARQLVDSGVILTEPDEQVQIRETALHHTRHLGAADRDALGFERFARSLEKGVAAHHAGMVPAFKETVEACFTAGLVKIVFATETLALGINMPARAVVLERMTKFNGDTHEFLTPLEYTQLTGRAGRRGIDDQGFAIALWSPFVPFDQVATLASSKSFSLRSVFRPTYNMAVNLVRLHDREGAHLLLDQSFGQYQADRDLTQMAKRRERLQADISALEAEITAAGGDLTEGAEAGTPDHGEDSEPGVMVDQAAIEKALSRLRPGDVIVPPGPGRVEPAAVLSTSYRRGGTAKVRLVARSHRSLTLSTTDFTEPPDVVGSIVMPEPYQPNNGGFQHEVARKLQRARLKRRRRPAVEHPVDDQPPRNDVQERLGAKKRQLRRLDQRMEGRGSRLARQFDDIVGILQMRGYVADWEPTPTGRILEGIFHESDMAIAEAVRLGVFDGLDPAELAAIVSCFTYEHRGPNPPASPRLRSAALRERFATIDQMVGDLRDLEGQAGVRLTPELDSGFVTMAATWAGGGDLNDVLDPEHDITGGDFVRQVRQLIDVLGQLSNVAPEPSTAQNARRAAEALHRGVVVASTAIQDDDFAG